MATPDSNFFELAISVVVGTLIAFFGWLGRKLVGRLDNMEIRLETLERQSALASERHNANLNRLDRIERLAEKIDDRLDRMMERE